MRVIVPGPLGWQSSLPIQMTRSPSTSLRAIAVFMMMPPDDRPRKKGGSMGGNAQGRHSLVAPSQRPVCDAHQSEYSDTVFRSCPPAQNTSTLNIQPSVPPTPRLSVSPTHIAQQCGPLATYRGMPGSTFAMWASAGPCRALPCAVTRTHALQQMPRRKPDGRDFAERVLRNIWPGSRGSLRLDVGDALGYSL